MEFEVFCDKIKELVPMTNKVVKKYFEGKFLNKKNRLTLPNFKE